MSKATAERQHVHNLRTRKQTNVQCVKSLMEFSQFGPLAQLMVIDALTKHTDAIIAAGVEGLKAQGMGDNAFISAEAWHGVAVEINAKLKRHLGR